MKTLGHLRTEKIHLPPGQEWQDATDAWRFVRLHTGAAYWLGEPRNRALAEGELLVIAPGIKGAVRASQLNEVVLHGFSFAPESVGGFLSLAERRFFETTPHAKPAPVQFLPSTHPVSQRFAALVEHGITAGSLTCCAEALGVVAATFEEEIGRYRPSAPLSTAALHRFEQLIAHMPDPQLISQTPSQLALLCACSARHFNRLFHSHFGTSLRARQTELRLLKASRLLEGTQHKVIDIALESGYRNLSLFNSLFKRRFGMTPSEWRLKSGKKSGAVRFALAALLWFGLNGTVALAAGPSGPPPSAGPAGEFKPQGADSSCPGFAPCAERMLSGSSRVQTPDSVQDVLRQKILELDLGENIIRAVPDDSTNGVTPIASEARLPAAVLVLRRKIAELDALETPKNAASSTKTNALVTPAASTNTPTFEVNGYQLIGNTLLPASVTEPVLRRHMGRTVTFDAIRKALADLQMAYRERGYVTVAVSLPQQQLTNGIVKVAVTEGRLSEINILNNHYFSSNNIRRELPCLQTNIILNGLVFQQELDRANANRDRQLYPTISPGPEPGTTILDLKTKDRLPLHVHFDLNNNSTPNTPELRTDLAVTDNNLWQLNHQVGVQYSCSPETYKEGNYNLYDQPLIANYSVYYRLPFSGVNGPPRPMDYSLADFGYNEATRRFRPPPPSGASELLFFASRSFSDTGQQVQSHTVTPDPLPAIGGLQVTEEILNRTLNPNEDVGARYSIPLTMGQDISSTVSAGIDFKNYRSTLTQTHNIEATLYTPAFGNTGPPWDPPDGNVAQETHITRTVFTSVQYLPLSFNWDLLIPDRLGSTAFTLGEGFNPAGLLSDAKDFRAVALSTNANGNYLVASASLTREQKVFGDWGVRLHADGQWANQPLISNEQFSLGGVAGPRGYLDGATYTDTGWRVQIEPHSPYQNLGLAFDKIPITGRFYTFVDYGRGYLLDPGTRDSSVSLLGAGGGMDLSIGEHFDARVTVGMPLLEVPGQPVNRLRATFILGVQF